MDRPTTCMINHRSGLQRQKKMDTLGVMQISCAVGRVRGETGWSSPDLPKWRSLNKYSRSPLRSHDHRKAAIKRLSECSSDRWSGISRDHSQVP